MDYEKHYNHLIEKAQQRSLETYTERHHILPRCLGGDDAKENIVALTPEEHYVAHQLLVKMYPKNQKLVYALSKMTQGRPSNKRYGWVKRRWQEVCKQRTGEANGSYGKSWYHHPETLENGKFLPEDVPDGWVKGRKLKHQPSPTCNVCGIELDHGTHANYCDYHRELRHKEKSIIAGRKRKLKKFEKEYDVLKYAIENSSDWREAIFAAGFKTDGYSRHRLYEFSDIYDITLGANLGE